MKRVQQYYADIKLSQHTGQVSVNPLVSSQRFSSERVGGRQRGGLFATQKAKIGAIGRIY